MYAGHNESERNHTMLGFLMLLGFAVGAGAGHLVIQGVLNLAKGGKCAVGLVQIICALSIIVQFIIVLYWSFP